MLHIFYLISVDHVNEPGIMSEGEGVSVVGWCRLDPPPYTPHPGLLCGPRSAYGLPLWANRCRPTPDPYLSLPPSHHQTDHPYTPPSLSPRLLTASESRCYPLVVLADDPHHRPGLTLHWTVTGLPNTTLSTTASQHPSWRQEVRWRCHFSTQILRRF